MANVVHTIDESTDRLVRSVIEQYGHNLGQALVEAGKTHNVSAHDINFHYAAALTGYLTGVTDMLYAAGFTDLSDERTSRLFNDIREMAFASHLYLKEDT